MAEIGLSLILLGMMLVLFANGLSISTELKGIRRAIEALKKEDEQDDEDGTDTDN